MVLAGLAVAGALLIWLGAMQPASAAELPIRKAGQWEIKIKLTGGAAPTAVMKHCTDETTDRQMSTMFNPLAQQPSPNNDIQKHPDRYTVDSVCRTDNKSAKLEDAKFVAMGPGYHVTSGPAAIYWSDKQKVSGPFTASATFRQTKAPTHPELLDWLAAEFMDSGWDVKHIVRLMVTSGTYRLSSTAPKELVERDLFNRELARASRWRLDAEFVRDNALAISGLLVQQVGGPSVKPYQPAGYWENLNFPTREWEADKDKNQWRRGLYTWWQRSYLQPSLLAFDAPTREECAADRTRSNIPQQALALLNDPTYVEAARVLAARMIKEGGETPEQRIQWAWRKASPRAPKPDEIQLLVELFQKHLEQYAQAGKGAEEIVKIGYSPVAADEPKAELAAYTSVTRAILNLHETITRY